MSDQIVKPQNIADIVPYSERHDRKLIPTANNFLIERHEPELFEGPFHHHTSVEINFLQGCEMEYSFSGVPVNVEQNRLVLFWGAQPHRVTHVTSGGLITNIYLSLGQFLRWGLPEKLVNAILSGAVIAVDSTNYNDHALFDRLWHERNHNLNDGAWRRTHLDEISTRLRRLGLEGWRTLMTPSSASSVLNSDARTINHVENILRYIADNFAQPITVSDIAAGINLSPGRAMALFREVMGVSIKNHLTRTRLSHAKMLLTESDQKIVSIALDSGFRSLSSFYDTFTENNEGISPAKYRRNMRQE